LSENSSSHTRLYVSNVNGIPLDRRGGHFDTLCKLHIEIQADLFCGQEHNLDTTQLAVRSILYDTARQYWPRNRMVFGTTPITFHTRYKPGGTFILSTGNLSGRVVKQTRDTMGRWVVQELIGSQGRKVAIVSAYQPVDKTIIPGTTTVAAQQHSLLIQAQDATIQPRQAFRRDLLAMLQKLWQAQCELLLVGDFNEAFGSDPEGMNKIAGQLGLVDIMASRHSSSLPTTFARGIKCLDYGLATQHVSDALQHAGYEAFNARVHSDH
jgi:exonuclease III